MMENLRQDGMVDGLRDLLKILVVTPVSSYVQSFRARLAIPLGPAAFRGLTASSVRLTSCSITLKRFGFVFEKETSFKMLLLESFFDCTALFIAATCYTQAHMHLPRDFFMLKC